MGDETHLDSKVLEDQQEKVRNNVAFVMVVLGEISLQMLGVLGKSAGLGSRRLFFGWGSGDPPQALALPDMS